MSIFKCEKLWAILSTFVYVCNFPSSESCRVLFCVSEIVFNIAGRSSCRVPGSRELGGRVFPSLSPMREPLGLSRPSPQGSTWPGSTPSCRAAHLPLRLGCGPGGNPGLSARAVGAGPGGAAPGRTGRWDAPRAGPAPARGRGGRSRAGAARTSVGGRVPGTWRAANAAAALEPRGLCARDEPHPEKGLLQAGRQQDRLGAAQDLRVPDPRRQRRLWRGVVRPLGMHARRGEQGTPGRRGGPTAGAQAPGRRWSLPHRPRPGQCTSSALPKPLWVSLLPLRTWGGASTTWTEDPKAQPPQIWRTPSPAPRASLFPRCRPRGFSWVQPVELEGGGRLGCKVEYEREASGCGRGWPGVTSRAISLFSLALWSVCGLD